MRAYVEAFAYKYSTHKRLNTYNLINFCRNHFKPFSALVEYFCEKRTQFITCLAIPVIVKMLLEKYILKIAFDCSCLLNLFFICTLSLLLLKEGKIVQSTSLIFVLKETHSLSEGNHKLILL